MVLLETPKPSALVMRLIERHWTCEEPGTLTQGGTLFFLVPLVWESNPELQGGCCKTNHQPIGGSDPNHQGIWIPPRQTGRLVQTNTPARQCLPSAGWDLAWSARTGSWPMWMSGDIFAAVQLCRGSLLTTECLSCQHPIVVCVGQVVKVNVAGLSVVWVCSG